MRDGRRIREGNGRKQEEGRWRFKKREKKEETEGRGMGEGNGGKEEGRRWRWCGKQRDGGLGRGRNKKRVKGEDWGREIRDREKKGDKNASGKETKCK